MKIYHVAIIENEKMFINAFLNEMKDIESRLNVKLKVKVFKKAVEFLIEQESYDFIYVNLDTYGFVFVEHIYKLDKHARIIFVGNDENNILDSYDYRPYGFLLKKQLKDRLEKTVTRVMRAIDEDSIYITLMSQYGYEKVPYKAIMYCQLEKKCLFVHTVNKVYTMNTTALYMERELAPLGGFERINKNVIVNMAYVRSVNQRVITLKNGLVFETSERKRREIIKKFKVFKSKVMI